MKAIQCYCMLFLALCCFVACQQEHAQVTQSEQAKITQEIKERIGGYQAAIHRKDIEWIKNFFSNDADYALASDGLYTTDFDSAVIKDYTNWFKILKAFPELDWGNGKITVLSKDAASFCTPFKWYALVNKGDTLKARGAFLFVFRKKDMVWKVIQAGGTHIYN